MQVLILTNTQNIYIVNMPTYTHTHTQTYKHTDGKTDPEVNVISKCDFTKWNGKFEFKSYNKDVIE